MNELIARGKRDEAVTYFMRTVGVPGFDAAHSGRRDSAYGPRGHRAGHPEADHGVNPADVRPVLVVERLTTRVGGANN